MKRVEPLNGRGSATLVDGCLPALGVIRLPGSKSSNTRCNAPMKTGSVTRESVLDPRVRDFIEEFASIAAERIYAEHG
jgi:hypothetical protein